MNQSDWENSRGKRCSGCARETMRFIDGKCPQCARAVVEMTEREMEKKATRSYYTRQLREGRITFTQMKQMKAGLP